MDPGAGNGFFQQSTGSLRMGMAGTAMGGCSSWWRIPLFFPQKGKQYDGQRYDHGIQAQQQQNDRKEPALKDICKSNIGEPHQQHELGDNQRKAHDGHERRILLGSCSDGCNKGENKAQAYATKTTNKYEFQGIINGAPQHELEQCQADQAHDEHQHQVEKDLCQNKVPRTGNRVEIQHSPPALLQKAFGDCVYANE